MKVTFYLTTTKGPKKLGDVTFKAGKLTVGGGVRRDADILFEGVDRSDANAVATAMQRAPIRFDGAYLRAEFVA